jgi:hypothetical protein
VTATFRNAGELSGEKLVEVNLNGLKAISQIISLQGGEEITFIASLTLEVAGLNTITLAGESRSVNVVAIGPDTSVDMNVPWGMVYLIVAIVGAFLVVFFILRRKR